MFSFEVLAEQGRARAGRLVTPHGPIDTPSFVPVGTQGTVKTLSAEDLRDMGTQVVITNAYHLHLQPGEDVIKGLGGLHAFMGWEGPLMMDSGGFQIFSLGAGKEHGVGKIAPIFPEEHDRGGHLRPGKGRPLVRVDADGVEFVSYLDGSRHRFTPQRVVEIEGKLGADIILMLDECTSPLHDYHYTEMAMDRTHRWALQALEAFHDTGNKNQALFGIVQGGVYEDFRQESASFIGNQDFDGFAIGGSLGRSKRDMYHVLEWVVPHLPAYKPRHLLGIGEIDDIFEVVRRGIDLFDCVVPTRMARTGTVFTRGAKRQRIHILNARFREDRRPIDPTCGCPTCRHYSRAYLRHLFIAQELLGVRLATMHNLWFFESLMGRVRRAIREGRLAELEKKWSAQT
ncbi:MAG: tRNA guanosine(34) transglycosylase Tgt [Thermodesulfobacteriota bacterium]|nr:tRNA guanosine(34) transglycosylase Tgt [Thermodesulfobacteriota bacterium]